MTTRKEKRRLQRERRLLRSEARWLQKALFALSKAETEHAKVTDLRGEKGATFEVVVDGESYKVEAVTAALKDAVEEWLELQRTSRRKERQAQPLRS